MPKKKLKVRISNSLCFAFIVQGEGKKVALSMSFFPGVYCGLYVEGGLLVLPDIVYLCVCWGLIVLDGGEEWVWICVTSK